jgi:hypothetical protein
MNGKKRRRGLAQARPDFAMTADLRMQDGICSGAPHRMFWLPARRLAWSHWLTLYAEYLNSALNI